MEARPGAAVSGATLEDASEAKMKRGRCPIWRRGVATVSVSGAVEWFSPVSSWRMEEPCSRVADPIRPYSAV